MPPKRVSTSTTPAMTQATIRQLIYDGIAVALEALAATMANTDNPNRNLESRETTKTGRYNEDLGCAWLARISFRERLVISSTDLDLGVFGCAVLPVEYHERACLVDMGKLMEVIIGGLPRSIEGNVTASKPQTLEEVITITQRLMEQNKRQEAIKAYAVNPTKNIWFATKWATRPSTAKTKDQTLETTYNQYP
nr:reverse transcriptase domain-containing protein [Tanacetum cinerariifolium]